MQEEKSIPNKKQILPYPREVSYIQRVKQFHEYVPSNYYFQDSSEGWKFPKLLPGHIFTFDYDNTIDQSSIPSIADYLDPKKVAQYSYQKPYYDLKPIGVSLGMLSSEPIEYILNLKAMPTLEAIKVLEVLMKSCTPIIEKTSLTKDRILKSIEDRLKDNNYVKQFVSMNPGYFRSMLGGQIYFWVNKYNVRSMKNVNLIDFNSVEKIALTNYKNDKFIKLNGSTIDELHHLYDYIKTTKR